MSQTRLWSILASCKPSTKSPITHAGGSRQPCCGHVGQDRHRFRQSPQHEGCSICDDQASDSHAHLPKMVSSLISSSTQQCPGWDHSRTILTSWFLGVCARVMLRSHMSKICARVPLICMSGFLLANSCSPFPEAATRQSMSCDIQWMRVQDSCLPAIVSTLM